MAATSFGVANRFKSEVGRTERKNSLLATSTSSARKFEKKTVMPFDFWVGENLEAQGEPFRPD
jgi:hypothetical protein